MSFLLIKVLIFHMCYPPSKKIKMVTLQFFCPSDMPNTTDTKNLNLLKFPILLFNTKLAIFFIMAV